MPPWIRTTSRPAALVAAFTAVLAAASAFAPAAADGAHEVTLRIEAPATFHMYNADEGAKAENDDFVVPVAVVPSDGGPARDVKVTVDTSGLAGVARAGAGGYGNCTADRAVFTCTYGTLQNGDGEANAPFTIPKQCPGVTSDASSWNCTHPGRCWMRWSPAFSVPRSGDVHRVHVP